MSQERKLSTISVDSKTKFDSVLNAVGARGRFQSRFNFVFNFLLIIVVSMSYMNLIQVVAIPNHWCHVPGRENTNFTLEEWKNITLPT